MILKGASISVGLEPHVTASPLSGRSHVQSSNWLEPAKAALSHHRGVARSKLSLGMRFMRHLERVTTWRILSHSLTGAIRTFACWVANGTVALPVLDGIDYSCILREPSALQQVYAIHANVLELRGCH